MSSENYIELIAKGNFFDVAKKAVSNISYSQRVELVEYMKALSNVEHETMTGTFSVDDRVKYTHKGVTYKGYVHKLYKKYVGVTLVDGQRIKVPSAMLSIDNPSVVYA
jgi:hypothetical protein